MIDLDESGIRHRNDVSRLGDFAFHSCALSLFVSHTAELCRCLDSWQEKYVATVLESTLLIETSTRMRPVVQSCRAVQQVCPQITSMNMSKVRRFAVYAVGEAWTGALGTGKLDVDIAGHFDEDDEATIQDTALEPLYKGNPKSLALGWGHTAIISEDSELLLTGRPHDFAALLRLKRLPRWMRNIAVKQTLQSTKSSDEYYGEYSEKRTNHGIANPTDAIGHLVDWLSDIFTPKSEDWHMARHHSIQAELTPMPLGFVEGVEYPVSVACSAGFSVYISNLGNLYAFGLNGYGQCGSGEASNNVWIPQRITGLSSAFASVPRAEMEQSFPVKSVALGLQHGICLNECGEAFCWGKGEDGQLGQEKVMLESHTALPVKRVFAFEDAGLEDEDLSNRKPIFKTVGKIVAVSAGMVHSAALTDEGQVLLWGKFVLPAIGEDVGKRPASNALMPNILQGLPSGLKVLHISCGSHHTSMLLEDGSVWAVGISSDNKEPIHQPVCLIPAGVVELPVRQFAAHMDRTTVVGASGRQVLQVNLWSDPSLREFAVFTPFWIDHLLTSDKALTIREVHRSWVHSVAVTDS